MVVQVIRTLALLLLVLVDLLVVDTWLMVKVNLPLRIINNKNIA